MSFRKLPEGKGMLYIPPRKDIEKKNPCPDCFSCLNCAEDRCRLCQGCEDSRFATQKKKKKKETE